MWYGFLCMRFYRPILQRAWNILWRVRYLWPLGLFAVLYIGPGGEYSLLSSPTFQAFANPKVSLDFIRALIQLDGVNVILQKIGEAFQFQGAQLSLVLAVYVLLGLILTGLIVLAQAVLTRGIGQRVRGRSEHLALLVQNVWPAFGRAFIIVVGGIALLYLTLFLLTLPFFVSYVLHPTTAAIALAELVVIFVFLPAFFVISFLSKYALAFVVLENRTTGAAVREAWEMFRRNWIATLELALLLAVINLVVFYLVLAIPLPLLQSNTVIGQLVFVSLLFVAGMLNTVFQFACWVLLFLQLRETRVVPKVFRLLRGESAIPSRPLPRRT